MTEDTVEIDSYIHMFIETSIGTLPVKVEFVGVEEDEDDGVRLSIDYNIDVEYEGGCPDLNNLPDQEAINLMEHLKKEIPIAVNKILEEEAKRIDDREELRQQSDSD